MKRVPMTMAEVSEKEAKLFALLRASIEKEARRAERARILAYMRNEIVLGAEAQHIADVIAEEIEHLNHYEGRGEHGRTLSREMPPEHHDHDVAILDGGGYCEDCHVELPKADVELIRAWENRVGP